ASTGATATRGTGGTGGIGARRTVGTCPAAARSTRLRSPEWATAALRRASCCCAYSISIRLRRDIASFQPSARHECQKHDDRRPPKEPDPAEDVVGDEHGTRRTWLGVNHSHGRPRGRINRVAGPASPCAREDSGDDDEQQGK